jgi:hypothetical protein
MRLLNKMKIINLLVIICNILSLIFSAVATIILYKTIKRHEK